ncbi:MAG: hypothetical protein HY290_14230 [Planctomycetia bacterium]|nr:hypothetical protein [Planctomycetia bacterium]
MSATWLTIVLAGCTSMTARPNATFRQGAGPIPPAMSQAPPAISSRPATPDQRQALRPAAPEKRTNRPPPGESQALPKSNAPLAAGRDPDEPPQPVVADNRLPKVESLPKIIPDEVTVPQLVELTVDGPSRRPVGAEATFQLAIRNAGDRPQDDLVVRCRFDETLNFEKSEKHEVVRRLDRLAPGDSRSMALTLSSPVAGSHCCWFTVARLEGDEEIEVISRQVCVEYAVRQIEVEITGPSQRTEGSRAEFNVSLSNPSHKSIVDAQVVVSFDKALVPKELSTGAEQRAGTLVWRLGTLEPDETVQLQMEFECKSQAHRACLSVEVKGTNCSGDFDEACLEIVPVRGTLDLRISDESDPLKVGQTGTYRVTVENIGLQAVRRVALEALASPNLRIRSAVVRAAAADLPLRHKLDGNQLLFDAEEQLEPGAHLVYLIEVEALRAGRADLRASLTSALSSTPITTIEPTTIVESEK